MKNVNFYDEQFGNETKQEYFDRLLIQNFAEAKLNSPSALQNSIVDWLILIGVFLCIGLILSLIF